MTEPAKPGDVLRNWLDKRSWTQTLFAEIIGRSTQWVNEVINSKKSITPESAGQLGAALGTSADYWLLLQHRHQLWVLSQDKQNIRRLEEIRLRAERKP